MEELTSSTQGPGPMQHGRQFAGMTSSADAMIYIFGGLNHGCLRIVNSNLDLSKLRGRFQVCCLLSRTAMVISKDFSDMIHGQTIGMTPVL